MVHQVKVLATQLMIWVWALRHTHGGGMEPNPTDYLLVPRIHCGLSMFPYSCQIHNYNEWTDVIYRTLAEAISRATGVMKSLFMPCLSARLGHFHVIIRWIQVLPVRLLWSFLWHHRVHSCLFLRNPSSTGWATKMPRAADRDASPAAPGPARLLPEKSRNWDGIFPEPGEVGRKVHGQNKKH